MKRPRVARYKAAKLKPSDGPLYALVAAHGPHMVTQALQSEAATRLLVAYRAEMAKPKP